MWVVDADVVIAADDAVFVDPHTSVGQTVGRGNLGLVGHAPFSAVMRMSAARPPRTPHRPARPAARDRDRGRRARGAVPLSPTPCHHDRAKRPHASGVDQGLALAAASVRSRRRLRARDGRAGMTRPSSRRAGQVASIQRTIVEIVAAELRQQIIDGTLPPGAPLRHEQIAAELGVSHNPVREAILSLDQEGWVRAREPPRRAGDRSHRGRRCRRLRVAWDRVRIDRPPSRGARQCEDHRRLRVAGGCDAQRARPRCVRERQRIVPRAPPGGRRFAAPQRRLARHATDRTGAASTRRPDRSDAGSSKGRHGSSRR